MDLFLFGGYSLWQQFVSLPFKLNSFNSSRYFFVRACFHRFFPSCHHENKIFYHFANEVISHDDSMRKKQNTNTDFLLGYLQKKKNKKLPKTFSKDLILISNHHTIRHSFETRTGLHRRYCSQLKKKQQCFATNFGMKPKYTLK